MAHAHPLAAFALAMKSDHAKPSRVDQLAQRDAALFGNLLQAAPEWMCG